MESHWYLESLLLLGHQILLDHTALYDLCAEWRLFSPELLELEKDSDPKRLL